MTKKYLSKPLSTFFNFIRTRTLTSIPQRVSPYLKPQSPSPPFTPYHTHHLYHNYDYSSFGSLRFCKKSLCSKPAHNFQPTCWNIVTQFAVRSSTRYGYGFAVRDRRRIRERKYDVGGIDLEGKYKEWQKKLHPDLVHSKSQEERDYAAEQSARVIDAYRTLSKPLSRAIYMLKLDGVEVDEEQTISDPELLAEIMEIREAVEEATNSEALNQIRSEMQEKMHSWSNAFADAFQKRDFEEAKNAIRRMIYYTRVIEEVVKKL